MSIQKARNVNIFESLLEKIQEHSKPLVLVLSFCIALGLLFFGYHIWVTKKEKAAQYDFGHLIISYENMLQEKNPEWNQLLEKFENAYQKHTSSSLLNYYLGYKVRILLQQNKKAEALTVLDTMLSNLPNSSLYSLYQTEKALIQLDMPDADIRNQGLETLKSLASDQKNMHRDTAQFYLGRYYWANDQIDAAQAVWQQLVDEQHDEKMSPSPWIQFVQDKLNLLDNE